MRPKIIPHTLILMIWLLYYGHAANGKTTFDRLQIKSLSFNTPVQCIYQDHLGFMWFGTWNGLYKYDGYDITIYKNDPNNTNTISDDIITAILEEIHPASTGKRYLWVGTRYGGLNRFDPEKEIWTHYQYDPQDSCSLSHNTILSIIEDNSGSLWIGTGGGGLNKMNKKTGGFSRFDSPDLSSGVVLTLQEDHSGASKNNPAIWLGTANGLNKYKTKRNITTFFKYDFRPSPIKALLEDHLGRLWIGLRNGRLIGFDKETNRYVHFPPPCPSLSDKINMCLVEDHNHILWVGTDAGLHLLKPKNFAPELLYTFKHNPINVNSLKSDIILYLYEDRGGVMWIGTVSGVNRIDLKKKRFQLYHHRPGVRNSLSHNYIKTIHEDRHGNLWVGTWCGGLNLLNRQRQEWTTIRHSVRDSFGLSSDKIHTIFEDKNGSIWIGTNAGLDIFNPKTAKFTHLTHHPKDSKSIGHNSVYAICQDKDDYIWIGTFSGTLNRYNPKNKRIEHFRHSPYDPYSFPICSGVFTIFEDSSHRLWFGTAGGGLARLDPEYKEQGKFMIYQNEKGNRCSLLHNRVYVIYQDRTGTIWVGTQKGLTRLDFLDKNRIAFINFPKINGSSVLGIEEDRQGNLWLSGSEGILKFNPRTKSIRRYDQNDGLPGGSFFRGSCLQSRIDGRMYFGGTKGIVLFNPNEITDNPHIPTVVLTYFKLFNETVPIQSSFRERSSLHSTKIFTLPKSIVYTNKIILTHQQNFFSFRFAALDFSCPEKNQYRYFMEGFNKEWINNGNSREATFTNLDPGEYTFSVKGSNNDATWNENDASIKIIILPPWWQT